MWLLCRAAWPTCDGLRPNQCMWSLPELLLGPLNPPAPLTLLHRRSESPGCLHSSPSCCRAVKTVRGTKDGSASLSRPPSASAFSLLSCVTTPKALAALLSVCTSKWVRWRSRYGRSGRQSAPRAAHRTNARLSSAGQRLVSSCSCRLPSGRASGAVLIMIMQR
jgi:hypothetical protein